MPQLPSRSDIMAATNLCSSLKADQPAGNVTMDCADVTTFSGAMAQLIVAFAKTLEAGGQSLTLSNVPTQMKQDLGYLGLGDHLRRWEDHA